MCIFNSVFHVALWRAEEGSINNGEEVSGVEQCADNNHANGKHLLGIDGAEQNIPFADKAGRWWQADHRQCADGKSRHGPGHAPPDTVHFTDAGLVRGYDDCTRAEEQRDFGKGVHDNMQTATDDAEWRD